ncbi:hypothetical protein CJ030_MR4G008616 [Morella rubra]|uniref:Uncharacterized protein n=1 Tax=Morella rubra TaxID=262757 RepID=A0A6A1VV52_9ROSI|nr:hypothetical protein CJ030_MR4G008616 [Morella rubra]
MTREERLAQQRVEILSQLVIVKREIFVVDFKEIKYQGGSIGDILDDQGWIGYLKREGVASVWSVTVRGVTFLLSAYILVTFMGMQRRIRAYPKVEMENKPDVEDIFCTFIGRNVVVVGPFVRQRYMLPFWHILHLIFAYNIEPRAHTTEFSIARGELMLYVARGGTVDLPLVGCTDSRDEERKLPLSPICRITLSRSEAQIRRQKLPLAPAPKESQLEEESLRHDAGELAAWSDACLTDLKEMIDAIILPTHQLFINLGTCLTSMESQTTGLQQFLTTTPGTLHVMSRRLALLRIRWRRCVSSWGTNPLSPIRSMIRTFMIFHVTFWIFMFLLDIYV